MRRPKHWLHLHPIWALAAWTALACPAPVHAQATTACSTPECYVFNQIWIPAGQLHELKNQFVTTVRQLVEALSSRYGDEGPQVTASLKAMEGALGRWDDGIRFYEGILAKLEDSAELHVGLGTVYLDRSRLDDALREFAQASRLDPKRPDAQTLSALAYTAARRPEDAVRSLLAASLLDPDNPITRYRLAQQLLWSGKAAEGRDEFRSFAAAAQSKSRAPQGVAAPAAPFERVSLFRQVAGVAPIFPLQMYKRGFDLLLDGRFSDGITELTRAAAADLSIATRADQADAVAEAGVALRGGHIDAARQRLAPVIEASPRDALAHRTLGVADWSDEQFDRADAELGTAIMLEPADERSRLALADLLVDAGRTSEAEAMLNATVQTFPESGQAHYRLGQLHQSRSQVQEAIREYEAASKLTPVTGLDSLFDTLGALYANQANFEGAVAAYSKRIEVNPNNAEGHRKLGEIYYLQGEDDLALAEFLATLLLEPASAEASAGAAQVYARMGRAEEAAAAARLALAGNDRLKEAHYALAMSLVRLGQTEGAKREMEIYQRLQGEAMASNRRLSELKVILLDASQRAGANDYAGAAARYRDALALEPDNVDVLRDLSLALQKSDKSREAIPLLEQAARLEDRAEVHELLASVYAAAGRPDDSRIQTTLAAEAVARRKLARLQRAAGAR
jgi:tetratricopeptide (TPR) repeat protein